MVTLDESYWAGSKRDKGKLRNLITEDTHDIRMMHTNPYTEDSFHAHLDAVQRHPARPVR